mmetsp:Transcript_34733/g.44295  ORF Transcript_34733/g.44295 Transcript_34733/m.44295 type:complete len:628 (+) Transcript_34733:584-2467(+)
MVFFAACLSLKAATEPRQQLKEKIERFFNNRDAPVKIDKGASESEKECLDCCGPAKYEDNPHNSIVNMRWNALHDAIEFTAKLVYDLHSFWIAKGESFLAEQAALNTHYAITLFLENTEYSLFIKYMVVYLTMNPDVRKASPDAFLAKFKDLDDFKAVLTAVTLEDLIEISPLMQEYFKQKQHLTEKVRWVFFPQTFDAMEKEDFWGPETEVEEEDGESPGVHWGHSPKPEVKGKRRSSWVNHDYVSNKEGNFPKESSSAAPEKNMGYDYGKIIHKDMEHLCYYLIRRQFFEHISNTKFNSYTAAIAVIKAFNEKQCLRLFKEFQMEVRRTFDHHNETANLLVQHLNNLFDQNISVGRVQEMIHDLQEILNEQEENQLDNSVLDNIEKNLTNCQQRLKCSCKRTENPLFFLMPEIEAAFEKALICFSFQILLYVAAVSIPEKPDREDQDLLLHIIVYLALGFTMLFGFQISMSEFINNTVTQFLSEESYLVKLLIGFNIVSNMFMPVILPYATAVILRNCENSLIEIILNSVAIFFVIDLDDMMLREIEIEALDEKLLYTYIALLHTCGRKPAGSVTNHLCHEYWGLRLVTVLLFLVSIYSAFLYETGFHIFDIARVQSNEKQPPPQ